MKDKIKFEFTIDEKSEIIKSLNFLRNYLTSQNRPIESLNEIIIKVGDNGKTELDKYEIGLTINALNNYRYKLKSANLSRKEINTILLKIINITEKKELIKKENER